MGPFGAGEVQGFSEIPIEDQIVAHIEQCDQCRRAIATDRPRAIGQKSGHCEVYWHLQLMHAKAEGVANNIVAHTEYGDEAPRGRPLE